jgi:hypothetical protein
MPRLDQPVRLIRAKWRRATQQSQIDGADEVGGQRGRRRRTRDGDGDGPSIAAGAPIVGE